MVITSDPANMQAMLATQFPVSDINSNRYAVNSKKHGHAVGSSLNKRYLNVPTEHRQLTLFLIPRNSK